MIYPNPRHLRAFIALAESGSFSAAAQLVHIGQPAMSQAVAGLESIAGVRLIERTTRSVRLTPAGEEFLVEAHRVLEANERLLSCGEAWAQARRGRIDLLAIPSMAVRLLPTLVRDYAQAHPEVTVSVHDHPDPTLRQRLERGEGDLAILTQGQQASNLVTLPFLRDNFRVLLAASHPLAERPSLEMRQLVAERLILLRRGTLFRSYMDVAIGSLQLTQTPLEVDQAATLVGMVEAGLGIAILPALSCPTPSLRSVVNRPLSHPSIHRLIAFALPKDREPMPAVRSFVSRGLGSLISHRMNLPEGCELLPAGGQKVQRFLRQGAGR